MFTGSNPPGPDRPIDDYPAIVEQESGHKVRKTYIFEWKQLINVKWLESLNL